MKIKILNERKEHLFIKDKDSKKFKIRCEKPSLAGSVSQRACVFCGSRVVLYPIKDALHLVHGPIGCASYTWDIRGALSSDIELHRYSFSTDLQESDIIYGGEKKLYLTLVSLIDRFKPSAAFVYSTCIVGVIGDDVEAVCKKVSKEKNISVLSVSSEGFKGTKKDGYKASCDAIFKIMTQSNNNRVPIEKSINILGEFNLAGETWVIKDYYKRIGINVLSVITGDCKINDIKYAKNSSLNVVQCSGSMTHLAVLMKEKYNIPFIKVSYFGIDDMSKALYDVADFFKDFSIIENTKLLVKEEITKIYSEILKYKNELKEKKAAIYVGGVFKAVSLIKALNLVGIKTVIAGSQTGNRDDYEILQSVSDDDVVIIDDTNPAELTKFLIEKDVDILIGGVKERPLSYKLGIAFCDHNHERKEVLAGFIGMLNFIKEVYHSINSPVWELIKENRKRVQDYVK